MSVCVATSALERALALSHEVADAAESGDAATAERLDAELRALLQAAKAATPGFDTADRAMLAEIAALNARALGALQHRQRSLARDLDMLCAGRRAVRAYSAHYARR
jgi:hypothetical protein